MRIIHYKFKNMKNKSDFMYNICGETGNQYIDPCYFIRVYMEVFLVKELVF